jgi:hypothetical protein
VGGVILHEITLCCKQRSPRFPTTRNCACPGNGLNPLLAAEPPRSWRVCYCCGLLLARSFQSDLAGHFDRFHAAISIFVLSRSQVPSLPRACLCTLRYLALAWVIVLQYKNPAPAGQVYVYRGNPMALALRVRRGKMAAMRGALRVVLISCLGGGTHALDNGVGLVPAAGERPQRTASCHSRRRRRRPASQCRAYAMCAGRACCSCRRRVAAIAAADAATSCRCRRPPFTERAMTRSYRLLVAGWSSWNVFGGGVTAEAVMGMADVMVEKGLDKLGYVCAFHAPPST